MIYIRSLFANIFFFGTLALGCVLSPLVALLPHKCTMFWWDKTIMPACLFFLKIFAGIKIEFRGVENIAKKPALYACKHESALETYSFTQAVPTTSYVLKKELTYIPFFGWSQHFYGMVPVDRKGGSSAMKNMLKEVAKKMQGRPKVTNRGFCLWLKIWTLKLFPWRSIPACFGVKPRFYVIPER